MKNYVLLFIFLCFSSLTNSQVHEIGISFGGTNFIGDIGSTTYLFPNQVGGGLFYKYNYNPRIALRGTLSHLPIQGNDADSNNEFRQNRGLSFTNTINEAAVGIEFNFYEYNILEDSKKWTPYLLLELAGYMYDFARSDTKSSTSNSMAIPFGFGFKSRLFNKIAFSLETKFRHSLQDNLENNLKGVVANSESDWYVFTGFSLIYTFGRPPCYKDGF
jgi:hypothetical protein